LSEVVSILGCGWLGLPLAERLLHNNYQVKGSTTTAEKIEILKSKGIKAYQLDFNPEPQQAVGDFFQADFVIINIPPQVAKKGDRFHIEQIANILKHIPKKSFIIYVSATSVYPNQGRTWKESDLFSLQESGNRTLFEAEQLITQSTNSYVIIRPGGLFGSSRMLGNYVQGRTMTDANEPVNYVHLEDMMGIIQLILLNNEQIKGQTVNAVCPEHPLKKTIALQNCHDFGLESPKPLPNKPAKNRLLDGSKIESVLSYEFIFRNPVEFTYNLH
jgi:nucleoside-diphosphate-sugar epimerase